MLCTESNTESLYRDYILESIMDWSFGIAVWME